jgi:hypothetical protein
MRRAVRLQTLLASCNSSGSPPLNVSFVVIVVNVINVIVSTTLPTGRASPPSPFHGSSYCCLASTQHTLEHSRDVNMNVSPGMPPSPPPLGIKTAMKMATRMTAALPSCHLPVTSMMQERVGVEAWTIAVAVLPGCSQRCRRHPRCRQWHQGCPPPPLPCCCHPHPPRCQCPLPNLPGRCSTPRRTCLGPPCRPSLLEAHQQCKLQVQQRHGPPLLCSNLPPLLLPSSWLIGCAGVAATLASL